METAQDKRVLHDGFDLVVAQFLTQLEAVEDQGGGVRGPVCHRHAASRQSFERPEEGGCHPFLVLLLPVSQVPGALRAGETQVVLLDHPPGQQHRVDQVSHAAGAFGDVG